MYFCEKCNWRIFSEITIPCPNCKNVSDIIRKPLWVRLITMLRQEEDVGVGDTIRRILENIGGERFKQLAKRIGLPCGCTQRQEDLNTQFPYRTQK